MQQQPTPNVPQGESWDDAYILVLGHGEIAVTVAYQPQPTDFETVMLLLEPGLGSGVIGSDVPARQAGTAVVAPLPGAVVLVFEQPAAVQVVIDKLEEIKEALMQKLAPPAEEGV